MPRLIDANALHAKLEARSRNIDNGRTYAGVSIPRDDGVRLDEIEHGIELVENAPIIDAVEVVRCRECKYCMLWNDMPTCERIANVMDGYYHGTVDVVEPDDFCSHGERGENDICRD